MDFQIDGNSKIILLRFYLNNNDMLIGEDWIYNEKPSNFYSMK